MRPYLDILSAAINAAAEALVQAEIESNGDTTLPADYSNERRRLYEAFYQLCSAIEDREIEIQKLVLLGEVAIIDKENMYLLEPALKEIKNPQPTKEINHLTQERRTYR